jgi:uncharacterized protein (DUF58 family)
VKEFDSWSERSVAIVIDADELPVKLADKSIDHPSDYAVRMAATAAAPLLAAGETVRVITAQSGQIRTTWSEAMADLAQIQDQSAGTSSR